MRCPGSYTVQQAYPQEGGKAATEGTVAHWVAAKSLNEPHWDTAELLGTSRDNIYITQEMLDYVELYVRECQTQGFVEAPIKEEFHGNNLSGTPDFWSLTDGVLSVKDLKYGFGWVEVYENWQLLTYASLIYFKLPNPSLCKTIKLVIVQPRANHPDGCIRSWSFDADLIRNYRNQILNAMGEASLKEPPLRTGEHCRYCNGLTKCHAARGAAGFAIDYATTAGHNILTPEALSLELEIVSKASKLLTQRLSALEEEGLAMAKKGAIIPGWEARNTVGPLAWDVEAIAVGDAMNIDLRQPAKPITPTQAINRKLLTKEVIKSLASRSAGGMKLKRVDNARAKRILTQ